MVWKTTVIQYLILKSQSKMVLDEGVERLENYTVEDFIIVSLSCQLNKQRNII